MADGKSPLDLLREVIGPDWYWKNRDKIHSMPVPENIGRLGFAVPERHTTSPLLEIGCYRTSKGGWYKTKHGHLLPTAPWAVVSLVENGAADDPF